VKRARLIPLLAFVAGGIGGTLLDQIHVRTNVLRYAHPDLFGQPWWVAPQFGLAVVAILLATVWFTDRAGRESRDAVPMIADAVAFVVAYTVTGIFHRHPWLVLIALCVIWAGMILVHRDRVTLVAISMALAVGGPVYESLLTWTGAFTYTVTPLALRVPIWLPALYLTAGSLAASTARAISFGGSGASKRER